MSLKIIVPIVPIVLDCGSGTVSGCDGNAPGAEGGCFSHCQCLASATRVSLTRLVFVLCWLAVHFHFNRFINIIGWIQEKLAVGGLASQSSGALSKKTALPSQHLLMIASVKSYPRMLWACLRCWRLGQKSSCAGAGSTSFRQPWRGSVWAP